MNLGSNPIPPPTSCVHLSKSFFSLSLFLHLDSGHVDSSYPTQLLSSQPADGHLSPVCPHDISSLRVHGERENKLSHVSSYKDTSPVGSGPHPYDLI